MKNMTFVIITTVFSVLSGCANNQVQMKKQQGVTSQQAEVKSEFVKAKPDLTFLTKAIRRKLNGKENLEQQKGRVLEKAIRNGLPKEKERLNVLKTLLIENHQQDPTNMWAKRNFLGNMEQTLMVLEEDIIENIDELEQWEEFSKEVRSLKTNVVACRGELGWELFELYKRLIKVLIQWTLNYDRDPQMLIAWMGRGGAECCYYGALADAE